MPPRALARARARHIFPSPPRWAPCLAALPSLLQCPSVASGCPQRRLRAPQGVFGSFRWPQGRASPETASTAFQTAPMVTPPSRRIRRCPPVASACAAIPCGFGPAVSRTSSRGAGPANWRFPTFGRGPKVPKVPKVPRNPLIRRGSNIRSYLRQAESSEGSPQPAGNEQVSEGSIGSGSRKRPECLSQLTGIEQLSALSGLSVGGPKVRLRKFTPAGPTCHSRSPPLRRLSPCASVARRLSSSPFPGLPQSRRSPSAAPCL